MIRAIVFSLVLFNGNLFAAKVCEEPFNVVGSYCGCRGGGPSYNTLMRYLVFGNGTVISSVVRANIFSDAECSELAIGEKTHPLCSPTVCEEKSSTIVDVHCGCEGGGPSYNSLVRYIVNKYGRVEATVLRAGIFNDKDCSALAFGPNPHPLCKN